MKSCPTCHRTFEDTFTFCLVDGSILSAPFNPQATLQLPSPHNTDPPPTQVQTVPASIHVPPTQPAAEAKNVPPAIARLVPANVPNQGMRNSGRRLVIRGLVVGGVVLLVLILVIRFRQGSRSISDNSSLSTTNNSSRSITDNSSRPTADNRTTEITNERMAEIIDTGKLYTTINSTECLTWPSPEIKKLAGENNWGSFYPQKGARGIIISETFHCDAQTKIYILKIGDYYVPIGADGVRLLGK